jgi:hypothetical protein
MFSEVAYTCFTSKVGGNVFAAGEVMSICYNYELILFCKVIILHIYLLMAH